MEIPISPKQQEPNFFTRILQKINPRPHPPVSKPEVKTELEEEIRQPDIGTNLIALLEQKGAIITSKELESVGASAIGGTNETFDADLIEKVKFQKHAPNGYLIGIGAGNVFRMLELYPEGQIPKAMILFDIDPDIVEQGQQFIEQLKSNLSKYYGDLELLRWIIPEVEKRRKLAPVLKQLAQEGNLVIAQADFTDERVTQALSNLPYLHDYSNVVYLSNISDHIWRRKHGIQGEDDYIPNFNILESLRPNSPLRNYYIDTTQSSLTYNLRIGTRIPKFDQEDFKSREIFHPGAYSLVPPIKPLDQIE